MKRHQLLDLECLENRLTAARDAWLDEKNKLDEAVAFATRNKTAIGDGYWQAEYRARQRYHAAQAVVDTIREEINA